MELNEEMKNEGPQKVGIIVELIKKSGDSIPVLFEIDRNELFEALESLRSIKDINTEKEKLFQRLVLSLMEIIPIDNSFFDAAVLCIASIDTSFDWFKENQNNPIAFGIMIHEGQYGFTLLPIKHQVWQDLLAHYKSANGLKTKFMK